MRSRAYKKTVRYDQYVSAYDRLAWPVRAMPKFNPYRVITVPVRLPIAVANAARNKIYPYPYPNQKKLLRKVLRYSLLLSSQERSQKWLKTKIRISLPRVLPKSRGSYVSLTNGRLNLHSERQLSSLLERGETNRRRYGESKSNRRKARNGQLDSSRSLSKGLVAHAYRRGAGIREIADAALVARAMSQGGRYV